MRRHSPLARRALERAAPGRCSAPTSACARRKTMTPRSPETLGRLVPLRAADRRRGRWRRRSDDAPHSERATRRRPADGDGPREYPAAPSWAERARVSHRAKKDAIVMHPGPINRGVELDPAPRRRAAQRHPRSGGGGGRRTDGRVGSGDERSQFRSLVSHRRTARSVRLRGLGGLTVVRALREAPSVRETSSIWGTRRACLVRDARGRRPSSSMPWGARGIWSRARSRRRPSSPATR